MSSDRRIRLLCLLCVTVFGGVLWNACDGSNSPRATLEAVADCADPLSDTYPCPDSGDDEGPGDDDSGGDPDDETDPGDEDADDETPDEPGDPRLP